jgi:hypothetical protein
MNEENDDIVRSDDYAVQIPSPSQQPSSCGSRIVISYVTDVEGDRAYLHRYVDQSKILQWRNVTDHDAKLASSIGLHFPYQQCIDFHVNDAAEWWGSNNATAPPRPILVFGGDVWDQGGNDLYVIRQLLHLHMRHTDSVYLVMGNRDINKMRVTQELGRSRRALIHDKADVEQGEMNDSLPVHRGVFWLRGTGLVGDPTLEQAIEFGESTIQDEAVARLQWMLRYTMGSPRAFAYRKEELMEERELEQSRTDAAFTITAPNDVTDFDVVESYRQSCDPASGELSLYLQRARLMLRLGNVAFVHGALPFTQNNLRPTEDSNTGSIWNDLTFAMPWLEPGVTAKSVGVESIDEWIQALNAFSQSRVRAWVESGTEANTVLDRDSQAWSWKGGYRASDTEATPPHPYPLFWQLLQYGMGGTPDGVKNPTVVYNSWGVAGKPRKMFRHDEDCEYDCQFVRYTKDFFQRTGVRLICSGHQPAGEMPNHIRIAHDEEDAKTSWILCCDTSYSGDTVWLHLPGDDESVKRHNIGRGEVKSGRGPVAVTEVLIEQDSESGELLDVYCHGTFSDGSKFTSKRLDFGSVPKADPDNLVVGALASGMLVPDEAQSPHGGQWWTQSALVNGSILLAAGEGFRFWTRMIAGKAM